MTTPTGGNAVLIYIDTSAAVKLARFEVHSDVLSQWVREQLSPTFVSSVMIKVELARAIKRSAPLHLSRAGEVLDGIGTVTLSQSVVARATGFDNPDLRSLDAIHLATAEHVASAAKEEFLGFLGYNSRLLDAGRTLGLPAFAPGLL